MVDEAETRVDENRGPSTVSLLIGFPLSVQQAEGLVANLLLDYAVERHTAAVDGWWHIPAWSSASVRERVMSVLRRGGMQALEQAERELAARVDVAPPSIGDEEWVLTVADAKQFSKRFVAAAWNWSGRPQRPPADEMED